MKSFPFRVVAFEEASRRSATPGRSRSARQAALTHILSHTNIGDVLASSDHECSLVEECWKLFDMHFAFHLQWRSEVENNARNLNFTLIFDTTIRVSGKGLFHILPEFWKSVFVWHFVFFEDFRYIPCSGIESSYTWDAKGECYSWGTFSEKWKPGINGEVVKPFPEVQGARHYGVCFDGWLSLRECNARRARKCSYAIRSQTRSPTRCHFFQQTDAGNEATMASRYHNGDGG